MFGKMVVENGGKVYGCGKDCVKKVGKRSCFFEIINVNLNQWTTKPQTNT
ncbi:hypothetical protein IJ096_02155 [Candidatus Saccharibacteria bacterium]|nr:hypothetical protein [Candidatus Saccharibacteria bacterium]